MKRREEIRKSNGKGEISTMYFHSFIHFISCVEHLTFCRLILSSQSLRFVLLLLLFCSYLRFCFFFLLYSLVHFVFSFFFFLSVYVAIIFSVLFSTIRTHVLKFICKRKFNYANKFHVFVFILSIENEMV